jgi:membrane protein insertase Oxa1/YidC/SpoIIIJ
MKILVGDLKKMRATYRRPFNHVILLSRVRTFSAAAGAPTAAPAAADAVGAAAAALLPGVLPGGVAPVAAPLQAVPTYGAYPDFSLVSPHFLDAGMPWNPFYVVQYWSMVGVDFLHAGCGLGWPAAVVAGSLALRAATFPFFMQSQLFGARMQLIGPAMQDLMARTSAASSAGDTGAVADARAGIQRLMASHNLSYTRGVFLPMFGQIYLLTSFFTGLLKMANQAHLHGSVGLPQAVEGTWLLAMHAPDPLYVLPAVATVASIMATLANPNVQGMPAAGLTPGGMRLGLGALSGLFGLVSLNFPAVRAQRRAVHAHVLPLLPNAPPPPSPTPLSHFFTRSPRNSTFASRPLRCSASSCCCGCPS